ncbi:nucleotidyltransferase family protein [Antarctobacter jejuensis]|uniref:nucleotidyltransferase family protein n=1 Tax=Antarctobacter jejuensis TaxID=1439938 RepID=UPI003FD40836
MDHSEQLTDIDAWLSTCLRSALFGGEGRPPVPSGDLINRMRYHGIVGTLAEDRPLMDSLPAGLSKEIQDVARGLAFQELAHQRILTRLAPEFAAAGIEPLILKGTAMAYSVYDNPALRPRGDTDIVVSPGDFERAQEVLKAGGFSLAFVPGGRIVTSQCSYHLRDGHGLYHVIDLHRQTNNHAALARLFPYAELRAEAQPLQRLHAAYLRPGHVDAMLFACYHRFMHIGAPITVAGTQHHSENRLIWLLDLVRIAKIFSEADWRTFVARARDKGLLRICHGSLTAARDCVGLQLPDDVLPALDSAPQTEDPVRFLRAGRAGKLLANLAATPGLGQKIGFLRETAFPPAAYMRATFGTPGQNQSLAQLYLRRAARGLGALMRKGGTDL